MFACVLNWTPVYTCVTESVPHVIVTSVRVCSVHPGGVVSLISLAVLSYERYSTMVAPTEADSSNYQKVYLGITLSWVYSLIWTVPPLFGWSHYGPEGPGTTCSVDWTAKTANSISYIICLFVFCLIVPFLVIVLREASVRHQTGEETRGRGRTCCTCTDESSQTLAVVLKVTLNRGFNSRNNHRHIEIKTHFRPFLPERQRQKVKSK